MKDRRKLAIVTALLAWSAAECAVIYPHYLGYFNELAGGPRNGFHWFWDSNVDWGQDLAAAGRYVQTHPSAEIIFASPYNGDRDYYLGEHEDLVGDPVFGSFYSHHINSARPRQELLIVSATLLDGLLLNDPSTFSWLQNARLVDRIANSTFVYDVTNDAPSHYYMGLIYRNQKRFRLALHEFRRSARLDPRNQLPRNAAADVAKRL